MAAGLRISIGSLKLAQFTPGDARALYTIRNHPSVRIGLAKPEPLPYKSHVVWVRENLGEGSDHLLFLVRWNGAAVGFTLLRYLGGGTVEIGVMFREADRYPLQVSLATAATIHCAFECLGMERMVSYPNAGNARALAINRAFGGHLVESDRPGTAKLEMTRDEALANESYRRLLTRIRDRMTVSGASPWTTRGCGVSDRVGGTGVMRPANPL